LSFVIPTIARNVNIKVTNITLCGYRIERCPIASNTLSIRDSFAALFIIFFVLISVTDRRAGSKNRVKNKASKTPTGAKIPSSVMGSILAGINEINPPAVVRLVIIIASPECRKVKAMASSLF